MFIKKFFLFFLVMVLSAAVFAQLRISENQRYFITKDGKPFFWLGDTAWELFHRLSRQEAKEYLSDRAKKGFNVILCVGLAELDGINEPNVYGEKPLINADPAKPNQKYFEHVDYIIKEAKKLNLIIALLPSWGDKWFLESWGAGPEIFTAKNARDYGKWLAKRYHNADNLIWVLGGDRNPQNELHKSIIRSMAKGIIEVDRNKHLITYHPSGGTSSFDFFKDEAWLDFHMSQSGHKAGNPAYAYNLKAAAIHPYKLHVIAEPNYEDHPNDWNPLEKGWLDDFDTREAAYWNILSGGSGHTYGNHNIWQMYSPKRKPVNYSRTHWRIALNQPGAFQMGYMKSLFQKRPWYKLQPFQNAIVGENNIGVKYKVAAISEDKDFMMVYIPYGEETVVNASAIEVPKINAWWFNPRDGQATFIGAYENNAAISFKPTSIGRGSDWVLVLDDAKKFNKVITGK